MESNLISTHPDYERPPITEAVIERRFAETLSPDTVEALRRKFAKAYPAITGVAGLRIGLDQPSGPPQMSQTMNGFRMVNQEGTSIIVLTAQSTVYSRLAPYPGWDEFSRDAGAVFTAVRDVTGYTKLARIGVRYINRIDVPIGSHSVDKPFELSEYFNICPRSPQRGLPALRYFTMQCIYALEDVMCQAAINVASVDSPIPLHVSFLLDIDLGRADEVPQKEDEIRKLLLLIRHKKNDIFNDCLTDKTKELFH
jgi:uncharacterized protein (TIGR04255 family)